jgi:hypothetical protein
MFSPQEKKQRIEENLGDPQNEQQMEIDVGLVPTLGHVAKETRFNPLRNLLEQVKDTPVNELGEDLRAWLKEEAQRHQLVPLVAAFLGACDAAIRRLETARKRPRHASSSEEEPGESSRIFIFYFFIFLFFPCSLFAPPELKPFNVSLLRSVRDVKVPPVNASAPPFTSEPRWLEQERSCVA